MGKKKRGHPDLEEQLSRPWCFYCERDFDDLKILISHQKAKHFKCERCGRRLNTAGGLSVHMNQVHKETLTQVENALPNRQGLENEIFGEEGIPEEAVATHKQRIVQQFYEQQAARQAATGNPPPGTTNGPTGIKKPKFEEELSGLKGKLASFRAKKKAQEAGGGSSGDATPMGAGTQSPSLAQSPGTFAGSPQYQQPPAPYQVSQSSPPPALTQTYGQPPFSQPQPQSQFPGQPPFPPQNAPYQALGQPGFGPPTTQSFSPPVGQPYPTSQQYPPPVQQYPGGPQFPPPFQGGPPPQFGTTSPPIPYHAGPTAPPAAQSNGGSIPPRPSSLPAPPGLPQRPNFGAPNMNSYQLQQMHHGGQSNFNAPGSNGYVSGGSNVPPHAGLPEAPTVSANATSVDELISSVTKQAAENQAAADAEKTVKKEKDKGKEIKLVYSDDEVSPEEKMAALPRYAFVPDRKPETVLGNVEAAVTGVALGPDDVMDQRE